MKNQVLHIIGGRPQFTKCLITVKALNEYDISNFIINTGQHFDHNMSKIFFKLYPKKYKLININLREKKQAERLAKMITSISEKINETLIPLVIIYGDTDSALAGLLFSMKKKFKVMHIESGLRSKNLKMPEEQNRIIIDLIADYLITPTDIARNNLIKENISIKKIYNYGDVMFDNVQYIIKRYSLSKIKKFFKDHDLIKGKYIYFSIHRESNSNIEFIDKVMGQLCKLKMKVLWPLHPKFDLIVNSIHLPKNLIIIKPLNIDLNLIALKYSYFIITDSGGIQKEGFFLKKKILLLRKETEWKELINLNCLKLIGGNVPSMKNIEKFLNLKLKKTFDYGNGRTTYKIAKLVKKIV